MLVSFKFECIKCGEYDVFFDTLKYPDRIFPEEVICDTCGATTFRLPANCGIISDSFQRNRSGVNIEALNLPQVSSKQYLKRYLKTNGISQLTNDEIGHHTKQKTKKERIKDFLDSPEIERKRKEVINKTLNDYGV